MYPLFFRVVVRRVPTEAAHHGWLLCVRFGSWLAPTLRAVRLAPRVDTSGEVEALGLTFPGPLGLAAGMDKNVTVVRGHLRLGFSHVEVGTVTPKAQPGNDKPRAWRELDVDGIRNRMGFNNKGAAAAARRLARLRRSRSGRRLIVGVNIGKNKVTPAELAAADYAACATALAPYADFLVVNVSSPNTPGLRDLQSTAALRPIRVATREAADAAAGRRVPLLVKIAPDLADADIDAIARLVLDLGLEGVEATNTTIKHDRGPGGLSGPPLFPRALEVVGRLRRDLGPGPVIIGVGGITTVDDARAMLAAGATILQGYTALIYEGPAWPGRINSALTRAKRQPGLDATIWERRALSLRTLLPDVRGIVFSFEVDEPRNTRRGSSAFRGLARPASPLRYTRPLGLPVIVSIGSRWTMSPRVASIAAIVSAGISTPEALTFSATCSGREAPMIAAETAGFCNTHATASCAIVRPRPSAIGFRAWTRSSTVSFSTHRLIIEAPPLSSVAREPFGAALPGRYFPVRMPWATGEKTTWPIPASSEAGMTSASMTR